MILIKKIFLTFDRLRIILYFIRTISFSLAVAPIAVSFAIFLQAVLHLPVFALPPVLSTEYFG